MNADEIGYLVFIVTMVGWLLWLLFLERRQTHRYRKRAAEAAAEAIKELNAKHLDSMERELGLGPYKDNFIPACVAELPPEEVQKSF